MSRGVSTMLTQLPARVARFPWADVDRRSRPAREIAADYWRLATDLDGVEALSTQQLALVERTAFLLLRIRQHECAVIAGEKPAIDSGTHSNLAGRLHGVPTESRTKDQKPFATCKVRASLRDGATQFVHVIAFDGVPVDAPLALSDRDSVALAGELTGRCVSA